MPLSFFDLIDWQVPTANCHKMNPKSKQRPKKSTNTSKSFPASRTPVVQHTVDIIIPLDSDSSIEEEAAVSPVTESVDPFATSSTEQNSTAPASTEPPSEELRRRPISPTGTFGKVRKHAYTRTSPYWKHFAVKHDENDELRIHCN
ncbi:hypothetical protein OUZ56_024302 [Daphnia magna]|uniref:Uncharacterized protein n=1 Tax=Daphnia magna TaxID=35525 RepID=A0ABR0B0L2_9CRUS|nr:hypothetical protein OUZ56_024302 [Daphnia magna]